MAGAGSFRVVSQRFAVGADSLLRHAKSHLPASLVKAESIREVAVAGTILERLTRAHAEAWEVLDDARDAKDPELRLKALARIEKSLELEARLLGELQEAGGATVNIILTEEWGAVRGALLAALAPFPEARLAVAGALRRMSAGG